MSTAPLLVLLGLLPLSRAAEKSPTDELSRTLHGLVVPLVPKQHEDRTEWGQTIPVPPDLRRPGLRRTTVMVGDRIELPQGVWQRTKVWFDEPAKDVQLRVLDQRKVDEKNTRLVLETTLRLHGERQRQRWLKGLKLFDLTARADVVVVATVDVDVLVELKPGKLLPELKVEPKVAKTKLELKEFATQQLDVGAGPVRLEVPALGEELRGKVQDWLRESEPRVTEKLNEVLAKAAKEGKLKLFAPKP